METNRYFYLKLYHGNTLAEYWLNKGKHGSNIFDHPAATIYFGSKNLKQIWDYCSGNKKGRPWQIWNQLEDFIKNAQPETRDKIYNLIYLSDKIYITKAVSEVFEVEPNEDIYRDYTRQVEKYKVNIKEKDILKVSLQDNKVKTKEEDILKVSLQDIVLELDRWQLPSLVSTAPCDQFLRTGTYREISDLETKKILSSIVSGQKLNIKQLKEEKEILNYLGIYELETLLFLILYHNSCRPSSWRGGSVEGIDIVGYPQSQVKICDITFTDDILKFQVKRKCDKQQFLKAKRERVYYVCIKDLVEGNEPFYLGHEWIWDAVQANDKIKEWLKGALSWIDGIKSL